MNMHFKSNEKRAQAGSLEFIFIKIDLKQENILKLKLSKALKTKRQLQYLGLSSEFKLQV